jgi:hypothetical protein
MLFIGCLSSPFFDLFFQKTVSTNVFNISHVTYLELWFTWMHSSRHWCRIWSPLVDVDYCSDGLEERSPYDEWRLRAIFFRAWRWSLLWRLRRSPASFRSSWLVLHATFSYKVFLDHIHNICFFVWDVAIHLLLGLANIYKETKRKLRLAKTKLDWFFYRGWSKSRDAKEKSIEKLKMFTNAILNWILITCYPATAPEKGASWQLIVVSKFVWICKHTNPRHSQGTLLPLSVNLRYRIRGTMCNARSNLISGKHFDLEKGFCI